MVGIRVEDGVRALRLASFAIAATVLALAAHVLGGGAPPASIPTAMAVVLPFGAGWLLSRRQRSMREIVVVLGLVQAVLHELFAACPAADGSAQHVTAGHAGDAAHVHGAPGTSMVGSHLLAVLVTAGLLAHGDRVLHLLMTWLRSVPLVVRGLILPVVSSRPHHATAVDRSEYVFPARRACAPRVTRGPPARVC